MATSHVRQLKAIRPARKCGKLGLPKRAADLLPMIEDIKAKGAGSLREIAAVLNERGIQTARGGEWSAVQVQRVLQTQ